jgi:NAD-dependent SIR2 family protein deacetylase
VATVWQMQFDTAEWPEYYRHLSELAQSEPRLVAQASEWIALAHVFLVLGTSSVVYPAAGLPRIALELVRGSSKSIWTQRS